MKNLIIVLLLFVLPFPIAGCSQKIPPPSGELIQMYEHGSVHEDETLVVTKIQISYPIMEEKIDKSIYADHKGNRVYFCCVACHEDLIKNPEKYIKKLEEEGLILEKVPDGLRIR